MLGSTLGTFSAESSLGVMSFLFELLLLLATATAEEITFEGTSAVTIALPTDTLSPAVDGLLKKYFWWRNEVDALAETEHRDPSASPSVFTWLLSFSTFGALISEVDMAISDVFSLSLLITDVCRSFSTETAGFLPPFFKAAEVVACLTFEGFASTMSLSMDSFSSSLSLLDGTFVGIDSSGGRGIETVENIAGNWLTFAVFVERSGVLILSPPGELFASRLYFIAFSSLVVHSGLFLGENIDGENKDLPRSVWFSHLLDSFIGSLSIVSIWFLESCLVPPCNGGDVREKDIIVLPTGLSPSRC
jgi:hypothetical protein